MEEILARGEAPDRDHRLLAAAVGIFANEPYVITRGLIEDGRKHLLLGGLIETGCPVRILQGVQDPDVPWQHAMELSSRLARDDVVMTLVKDGDHRLSRPEDIERLIAAVKELSGV